MINVFWSTRMALYLLFFETIFFFFAPILLKISQPKKKLSDRFCISDIEAFFWYLSKEITTNWVNQRLFIDQTAFIDWILENLKMKKYKSAKIPIDSGIKIVKSQYKNED